MATTTNYSWSTPDDTAYVKDGASAIRTLGSSVDTTTKALNPSTTLGDIEYRSATSNTNTRLGIGSTGQVLTVAAGVPAWGSSGIAQIATGTVASTSVVISSIPQTYKHLYLVVTSAQLSASGNSFGLRFNTDSTSSYSWYGFNAAGAMTNLTAQTFYNVNLGGTGIPTTTNNQTYTALIENYSLSKYKNISGSYSDSGTVAASHANSYVHYNNTTAISTVNIVSSGGSGTFSVGTYTLYGVS